MSQIGEAVPPRILVIDDTISIHEDFDKVLGATPTERSELADLEAEVFSDATTPRPPPSPVFRLVHAFQGEEGVRCLEEALASEDPAVLAFVDMRMPPGWDGLRTIQELWDRDPNLQVVICTAYSDHGWSDLVATLGASDRLLIPKKPFEAIELRQMTVALTEKWRLQRMADQHRAQLERTVAERTAEFRAANHALREQIQRFLDGARIRAAGPVPGVMATERTDAVAMAPPAVQGRT